MLSQLVDSKCVCHESKHIAYRVEDVSNNSRSDTAPLPYNCFMGNNRRGLRVVHTALLGGIVYILSISGSFCWLNGLWYTSRRSCRCTLHRQVSWKMTHPVLRGRSPILRPCMVKIGIVLVQRMEGELTDLPGTFQS